ncbi:carboxypeptidase B-like isoform X1 [Parasteatoda tepidariorum]|uniref:carboxypeptidase B-like isoform X1 n=1 Tax=Parasteatoda tepidariorum TaxID=114398 RepID=UPI0039BC2D31
MNSILIIIVCGFLILLIEVNANNFSNSSDDFNIGLVREERKSEGSEYDEFGYDFLKHNSYSTIVEYLRTVTDKYKSLAKMNIIGRTYEDRKIIAVHVTKESELKKKVIVFECGVHAREWTPIETCIYVMKMMIYGGSNRTIQSQLLEKYHLIFLPVVNPDGYVYSFTHDRMWRKNRRPMQEFEGKICVGVDINRNFDTDFCKSGKRNPCSLTYCGPEPFSEKENQAIRRVLLKHHKNLLAYFSIHSFGNLWMTPFSYKKDYPKDYNDLLRVALAGVEGVKKLRNTSMKIGPVSIILYGSDGTSIDYAYLKGKAKYSFALELGKTFSTDTRKELALQLREYYDGFIAAMMAM